MTSLAQSSAVGDAVAKSSAQPQQSFSDSLFTASKAYSENDSVNDGNTKTARRQKSASEDEQTAGVVHRDDAAQSSNLPLQMVQPAQVIPAQQSQVTTPDAVLSPLSFAGAVTTASTSSELPAQLAGVDSNIIQSGVDPSQAASIQSGSETQNIEAAGTSSNAIPNIAQSEAANTVRVVVPSTDSSSLPEANPAPVFHADLSTYANAIFALKASDYSAPKVAPSTAGTDQTLPATDLGVSGETANQSVPPIQPGGGLAGTAHVTLSSFNSVPVANQTVTNAAGGKDVSTDTTSDAAKLEQLVQAATDQAGSQAYSQQDAPVVVQSQSTNSADAAKLKQIVQAAINRAGSQTYSQQDVPAVVQSQSANSAQVQSGTLPDANLSTIQQGGGLAGKVHATVSSLNSVSVANQSVAHAANGKDQSSDATSGTAGLNQHAQFAIDKEKSTSGSGQDAPVGGHSQNGASSQEQSATPSQTISATNSIMAILPAQNTSTASPAQSGSIHAGVTASAAKLPEAASFASPAVTQTSPVINTAKLIQSIGQSEMRVGMRSSEFGNISISTTASKDSILARISLDHGELAKALAAQLPEMQARLGGNRQMDVRIDMSGAATGQGTGSSGTMSSGTSDQSSSGKQQSAYAASSYSDNSAVERPLFPVGVGPTTGDGSLNARLDIRV